MSFNLEELSDELGKVDEEGLSRVGKLGRRLQAALREVEQCERDLKAANAALKKVQEEEIPALMQELRLQSFKLEDGSEVTVKPYYSASISKDSQDAAFQWLNENGFGDLIKNVVANNFSRGQEQDADKFAQECIVRGLNTSTKKWVEPMTLKAFVKEQLEKGKSVPTDLFGVYVGQKATIKGKN